MRISQTGLSPAAHGTLRALQSLQQISFIDDEVARELIARGYAAIHRGKLRVTEQGQKARTSPVANASPRSNPSVDPRNYDKSS